MGEPVGALARDEHEVRPQGFAPTASLRRGRGLARGLQLARRPCHRPGQRTSPACGTDADALGRRRHDGCDAAAPAERTARAWQRRVEGRPAGAPVTHAPLFELSWLGGPTEQRLHKRRPGADEMPWGSIDLSAFSVATAAEARQVWTNGVFTEYASAAAFASLTTALLECGAPVDLIAASADIVVDELFHVELSARLTTELGGAAPLGFDLERISPRTTPGSRALMRAAELAVTTSCVSESLSVPAMARSRAMATVPLVRDVLGRLLADEGTHARLGYWFLDWAVDRLTTEERAKLGELAVGAIEVYAPLWLDPACPRCPVPSGLGGHDEQGRKALREAVTTSISGPLAARGILLDGDRLARLL